MDIRTKLVFALVAVALASMLALAFITYGDVRVRIRDSTLDQLGGLASSKEAALEGIIDGWHERVALIASRTQLRISLRDHPRLGQPAADRIERILADALQAAQSVELLAVYDLPGDLVASVRRADDPVLVRMTSAEIRRTPEATNYVGVAVTPPDPAQVGFTAALAIDGETVGFLYVVLSAVELVELTTDFEGLGRTGEVLIVAPTPGAASTVLNPLRNGPQEPLTVLAGDSLAPTTRALRGEEGRFWEGVRDYRSVPVWAATRFLPETGWGLVVKIDEVEEVEPIVAFRSDLLRWSLILAAFAIFIGTLLGMRFAVPIQDLAQVAERVGDGDLSARAHVWREDEVGLLARTFNEMADDLERRVAELREFRKFFDVSVDMMCIAGTDGFFRRTNPAFERELGWSVEELTSRPFFDFVHPDDIESTHQEVAKLAEGIPTISFENRYRCADGSYKVLRWAAYPEPETGVLYSIAHVVESGDLA